MYSRYDFIKDLNPSKEDWRIKVSVVRTWKVPNFQQKDFDDNLNMVLLDETGSQARGTLWEQHVDKVQSFLANNQSPQNLVIVQLARIKGFMGKIGITNTKYTTRILFDSSLLEIVEFKKRLSSDPIANGMRLTQLSNQSSYSFENDFLKDTERKSIGDISNCGEITTCITYGTIKSIESKYNWWYKSCKKCPYSVCEDFEKLYCKNCHKHWDDYYPNVQVRVMDDMYSASFILFDRDCVALLGMGAAEIRKQHFKRGADLELYPEELNILNEKSMLFKDETTFDNTYDNDVVSQERGCVVDVESQTCESIGDADKILIMALRTNVILLLSVL
ncbi:uncharacterized protein LOC133298335 [Gastrolobium bilobum]|uniref:uncharacterized protein LOC133298335 n=1 Tax=Gastrolobium bilobum TaxID=150636 RepID=UPI002AB1121E|nr:uncharacterized protein LOC133298335 [Gastrolobium bilobum]